MIILTKKEEKCLRMVMLYETALNLRYNTSAKIRAGKLYLKLGLITHESYELFVKPTKVKNETNN